jgi:hypothetical protein
MTATGSASEWSNLRIFVIATRRKFVFEMSPITDPAVKRQWPLIGDPECQFALLLTPLNRAEPHHITAHIHTYARL